MRDNYLIFTMNLFESAEDAAKREAEGRERLREAGRRAGEKYWKAYWDRFWREFLKESELPKLHPIDPFDTSNDVKATK